MHGLAAPYRQTGELVLQQLPGSVELSSTCQLATLSEASGAVCLCAPQPAWLLPSSSASTILLLLRWCNCPAGTDAPLRAQSVVGNALAGLKLAYAQEVSEDR